VMPSTPESTQETRL